MATITDIKVGSGMRGEYAVAHLTEESAKTVSEVLQENHDRYDIILDDFGLHNHIVHHILTVFALGASSDTIRKHYLENAKRQRPPASIDSQVLRNLHDPSFFVKNLGTLKFYPSYRTFFEREIFAKGYETVFNDYIFGEDERAKIMLCRLYAGVLHPFIHLGFATEFQQPAIIAEALGQTAIHPPWLDKFFPAVDEAARQNQTPSKSLVTILEDIFADKKLSTAAHWNDKNLTIDGVFARAWNEMVTHASHWCVDSNKLEEATAEIANAAAYVAGSAQHPPKRVKFDFYFMHSVNSSIGVSSLMNQPWISNSNKAKILEYKGRLDLLEYASRGCPKLLIGEVEDYAPRITGSSDWDSISKRANMIEDDGHAAKLVRALAHGQKICAKWEEREAFRIKGKMWLQLGNMAIDSVEDAETLWVRHAGFEEAWESFDNRTSLNL